MSHYAVSYSSWNLVAFIKPVANLSLGEHSHAVVGGESTYNSFDKEDIAPTTCTSDDSGD
jgi:hypothetical protein